MYLGTCGAAESWGAILANHMFWMCSALLIKCRADGSRFMALQDPAGGDPGGVLCAGGAGGAQCGQQPGEGALPDLAARGLGIWHGRRAALALHQLLHLLCAPQSTCFFAPCACADTDWHTWLSLDAQGTPSAYAKFCALALIYSGRHELRAVRCAQILGRSAC